MRKVIIETGILMDAESKGEDTQCQSNEHNA